MGKEQIAKNRTEHGCQGSFHWGNSCQRAVTVSVSTAWMPLLQCLEFAKQTPKLKIGMDADF